VTGRPTTGERIAAAIMWGADGNPTTPAELRDLPPREQAEMARAGHKFRRDVRDAISAAMTNDNEEE
jgi:hypothetical protein